MHVNVQGAPSNSPAPSTLNWLHMPLVGPGLCGQLLRAVHEVQAKTGLQDAMPSRDKARLRSAGGPVAGRFLAAAPDGPDTAFGDEEFRRALRWRQGLKQCDGHTVCQLKTTDGDVCGKALGADAVHAAWCKCGPGVGRVHSFVADFAAECCRPAGLSSAREVTVPMWTK